MPRKTTPRRTGKMRAMIVRWPFTRVFKVPKKTKNGAKQEVVLHTPTAW